VGFLVRRHGLLRTSSDGLAVGGVLIRHLVLPTAVSQTRAVLQRVRRRFGRRVALSLMTQYFPAYKAHQDPRLHRALRAAEKRRAWRFSRRFRIRRGWRQNDE
jgi:putative pyruvate formate lyase activating enzyme